MCECVCLSVHQDNHIHVVMVPANFTDRLQPLDISVNKPAKTFLRQSNSTSGMLNKCEMCQHLQDRTDVTAVDLQLSVVKPLGAQWMIQLYEYMKSKPDFTEWL